MKSVMLKEFVVCEEYINDESFYTVRVNTDCSSLRFKVLADFNTYEEADDYINYLRHPEDYFDKDDQHLVLRDIVVVTKRVHTPSQVGSIPTPATQGSYIPVR